MYNLYREPTAYLATRPSRRGCKTRNDGSPLFWLTTCGHPLRPLNPAARATQQLLQFSLRERGGIKAEVMSGPEEEEGEKAKGGGVMAVKGPTVLVVCDVANETDEVSMT